MQVGEEVRRSEVKKVEIKSAARREVEQGPTAPNYKTEFRF
jgi:hypothetical protein